MLGRGFVLFTFVSYSMPIALLLLSFVSQVGDSLMDQGFDPYPQKVSQASPLLCATEYEFQPQHLRLPVLNPFDNFLKAAGC